MIIDGFFMGFPYVTYGIAELTGFRKMIISRIQELPPAGPEIGNYGAKTVLFTHSTAEPVYGYENRRRWCMHARSVARGA
jgi:hypothetical protein